MLIVESLPHKNKQQSYKKNIISKHKPNLTHLHIFNCKIFVHIPKEEKIKLPPKAFEGIMVGYDEHSKVHTCYDSTHQKIFMSKDVNLDELFVFTLQHILYDPFPLKYINDGLLLAIQTHMKVSLPMISESR
jgi:hypothetical protein